ncbi:twin-arginine translocase subunit TatC [Hazenella sp. IB182357]|uniref:Sec-independent protein translocase protein TatC n=1 Tax=Polycladospora coralii TaxID=2771432 RepID=A0A926RTZ2_9BACL|nr:twin-arginine translocase subunit TatC [Polycladospora coralii]MBD1372283.1 twin-arginine translocase subunit TatC [Polycladospora coralii]MBS7531527.1 twin-arginine translocase subunit TatC [Polycladospora coralii]
MSDEQRNEPLTQHLTELRNRIIWILVSFVVALIGNFVFAEKIYRYIKSDLFKEITLNTITLAGPLKVWMQIAFVGALIITVPIILYHIWQFVRPGLHPKEQKAALMYIPFAILLFILGISFGYFLVIPFLITFLDAFANGWGIGQVYTIEKAFGFVFSIILPISIYFELPVIVLFLVRIRILSVAILKKIRRFAYLGIVVLAAIITPAEIITNLVVAIPMILLYEFSILLAWRLEKKLD